MSNEIIPLLNAQQQGMSTTIGNIATRVDVMSQVSQYVSAQVVADENKKLEQVAEDSNSSLVSQDSEGHTSHYGSLSERESKEEEEKQETNPSYHNPLAGKLLNTKV